VGLRQGRQVVVGEEDPLASDAVVGRQPGPQGGIGHRLPEMAPGQPLGRPHEPGGHDEPRHHLLPAPVDPGPGQLLDAREVPESPLLGGPERPLPPGEDPRRRPLEDRQVPDPRLDLRDELDGRGAGADDGHPLAGEVVVVAPAGGVEHRALEPVDARQRRNGRFGQRAGGRDEDVGLEVAVRGLHPPAALGLAPGGGDDLVVEPDVGPDAEVAGHPLQVGLDLGLGRERPAPVGVRGEGEGVEVGRDVTGGAGIGVVPPGAADLAGPFEDDEVLDAGLLQAGGHAEAGEARPDDEHAGPHRHGVSHSPAAFHSILEAGVMSPSSRKSRRVLPTESRSSRRPASLPLAARTTSPGIPNRRTRSPGGCSISRAITPSTTGARSASWRRRSRPSPGTVRCRYLRAKERWRASSTVWILMIRSTSGWSAAPPSESTRRWRWSTGSSPPSTKRKNRAGNTRASGTTNHSASRRRNHGMPRTGRPERLTNSWNISVCWDSSMISWWR